MPQALWVVADRYIVGNVVGRGGYGMVYRGLDRKTGTPVALKMLSPEAGRNPEVVERMLREQQALVALNGTCAVTAVDLCRLESGAPCLVMEWLEGRDLEQQLAEWEASARFGGVEALLALLAPISDTLERAHSIGIVHRDIKPANIFLTAGGAGARLLDFGLASMKSAAPLTEAGMVMGSPSYIAPEIWRGQSSSLDGRADLYSLGVIVFRWLTGKLPFENPDLVGKMLAVTSGPRPSAAALRGELPQALDAWVARALAVEPADRFASGFEFRSELCLALTGRALPSRASGPFSAPRALVDAQQALSAALRTAAGLLKRFTLPLPQKAAAAKPASVPAPAPAAVSVSAAQPRNTVWLDSSELEQAARGPNTVWLDSSELEGMPLSRNTVWLDSNELLEVAAEPEPRARRSSNPPPLPNRQAKLDAAPSPVLDEAKGKARLKTAPTKSMKKAKARVSARKRRKALARKSSR